MKQIRAPFRLALAAACLPLLLGGCTTWRAQLTPPPAVQRTLGGPVRVTRGDGRSLVLDSAAVRGDSIVGVGRDDLRHVSIPLAQVTRVERKRVDPARTAATVGVVALAVAAAFGAYVYSVMNDPNY
ncbi:MAG TPA: hypothetical protein VFJ16_27910 [Longimicrobium sp.]|nr:hypothetical protein [Longimicrobium sp.]